MDDLSNVFRDLDKHFKEYMAEHGRVPDGAGFVNCINPNHPDRHPSMHFIDSGEHANTAAYCFSCLPGNQEIRTPKGLIEIKDLKENDEVYSQYGISKITKTFCKKATEDTIEIELESIVNDNQFFTGDHIIKAVTNMNDKVSYLSLKKRIGKYVFNKLAKHRNPIKKYRNKINIQDINAKDLKCGDYLVFPKTRKNIFSKCTTITNEWIKDYTKGPKNNRINRFPINIDTMWLLGIYCAEGSSYRGGITFTLNRKEKEFQQRIIHILKKYFNLESSIYEYDYKENTTNISCSSTDLQKFFDGFVGKYSDKKKLPYSFILHIDNELQKAWLDGLFDGDASNGKSKVLIITGKDLVAIAQQVMVNLEIPFSYKYREAYLGNDGIYRKQTYYLRWQKRETADCFYDQANDEKRYCFLKIKTINTLDKMEDVYDITVDDETNSHTFMTKHYLVHNCHTHCSILNAAHYLENKPLTGIRFYEETLPYLCKKYNVPYEPIKVDNKTRDMYQKRAGVRDAINVMHGMAFKGTSLNTDHPGIKHLLDRGITEASIRKFKIGVITSLDAYLEEMRNIGYDDPDWLASADLSNKNIFNPDAFISPIFDEKGRPVGFVSRTTKLGPNAKGDKKYCNSVNSDIYNKSEILFNFNNFKPDEGALWIVEGYVDAIYLDQCGLKNVTALGSTALTEQHVDLLSRSGAKNLILMLDGDEGGRTGTDLALSRITPYQIFKSIRIIELPDGLDPDSFVREKGLEELKKLAHPDVATSPFTWTVKKFTFQDDPIVVVEQAIPMIIAEESTIKRLKMIKELSKLTGVAKEDIRREVELRINKESDKLIEELTEINKYVQTALSRRKVKETKNILEEAIVKVRGIELKYNDVLDNHSSYAEKRSNLWNKVENGEYKYGLISPKFKKLEEMYDGIPYTTNLTLIGGKPSSGKCLGKGTKIWTPTGLINVEDVKIGDKLIGDDGSLRIVLSTTNGEDNLFKVSQQFGMSYICNTPHILTLKGNYNYKKEIIDIPLNEYLNKSNTFKRRYKGFKIPINFSKKTNKLDPYFLGLWLGDGSTQDIRIHNTDIEVEDFLKKYSTKLNSKLTINKSINKCPSFAITKLKIGKSLQSVLREENLIGNKHIPKSYIFTSESERLELLAGLIDSDGYLDIKKKNIEITQVKEELAKDIKILADTLGFRTSINKKKTSIKSIGYIGEAFRVLISGDIYKIPTKIKRKKLKKCFKRDWSTSKLKIESIGIGKYYGFELDGNGRFLLEDGTVTHNTTWCNALAVDLVEANEDVAVFFMTIDDTTELMTFKMMAQKTGFATSKIKQYINLMADEQKIILDGWKWLDKLSSRFIMADATEGTTPEAMDAHIEWFIKEYPNHKRIFFLDNFHKLSMPHNKQKTDAVAFLSEKVKEASRIYDTHIIMTTELRKMSENNSRPTPADLKDTVQLEYDADSILMVHNDLLVKEDTNICWAGNYNGTTKAMPYLEVGIYKNKHTGKTGGLAYRLNTYNLQITEDDYATIRMLKSQNAGHQKLQSTNRVN
jgi:DNA primase catalytic core